MTSIQVTGGRIRQRVTSIQVTDGRIRQRVTSIQVSSGRIRQRVTSIQVTGGRIRQRVTPIQVLSGRIRQRVASIQVTGGRIRLRAGIAGTSDSVWPGDAAVVWLTSARSGGKVRVMRSARVRRLIAGWRRSDGWHTHPSPLVRPPVDAARGRDGGWRGGGGREGAGGVAERGREGL